MPKKLPLRAPKILADKFLAVKVKTAALRPLSLLPRLLQLVSLDRAVIR